MIYMTAAAKGKVGKPVGTRSIPTLHAEILRVLQEDKDQSGDGMTAYAISKALAVPDPTIRLYIGDLVKQKKVSSKRIAGMTLYRIRAKKSTKSIP
jgi:hypothetical protein